MDHPADEDAKWDLAWSYFAPLLHKRGYALTPRLARMGGRMSASWPPAADPFNPGPYESFVGYSVCCTPFSLSSWGFMTPSVHRGSDHHDRDIYFKLIPPYHRNSKEVEIWRHLSSEAQRKDARNHTLPLLDVLEVGEWFLLVTPSWECDAEDSHRTHIDELLDMGLQLFEGLDFMHDQGIVHRDISMSNVRFNHCRPIEYFHAPDLFMFTPAYAFMDFGLAQRLPGGPGTGQTVSGFAGTERFCAPEVKQSQSSESAYDPFPADVYALGSVLKTSLLKDITERWKLDLELTREIFLPYDRPHTALSLCVHAPEYLDLLDQVTSRDATARPSAKTAALKIRNIIANMTTSTLELPTAPESQHLVNSYRNVKKYYALQEFSRRPQPPKLY